MIHASDYKPRVYPYTGHEPATEIDRLQELTASVTLNRTKIKEIGRDGVVGWHKGIPTVNLTLRQYEYGSMEFWQQLANTTSADTSVALSDFASTAVDIAAYKTEESSGAFLSTFWYPNSRLTSWSLNIGSPDAIIERSFSLSTEDEINLMNANKYLVMYEHTASGSGTDTIEFGLGDAMAYPAPVMDPDNSGQYFLRAQRIRGGVTSTITEDTDFTYDPGSTTITIAVTAGDVIKFYYSTGDYISGASLFTNNDSDVPAIAAHSASIYLVTSDYVYRLQSCAIDVAYERQDVKEIGNDEVVQRGIKSTTVTVRLGRMEEAYTIEEIMRGVDGDSYGKIDIKKFPTTGVDLIVKLYSDETKTTFKIGYRFDDLTVQGLDRGAPVDDYITTGNTLEGETGLITSVEGSL